MNTNIYQFDHDNIGNRTYVEFPGYEAEYEVDKQNAYTEISLYHPTYFQDQFSYDLDGNMLTNQIKYSSDVWAYTWDGENRMTSATNTQDCTYVTYKYDYQGRMISKNTSHGGTETRRDFIWNGNYIVAEMTASTTNLYTWLNGETLTASLDGETVFYAHDANKNVTDLVDETGTHLVHYDYSPFGVQSSTVYSSPAIVSLNPFRFSNEYFDNTTGFVEYKYRKYNPYLGKFLSRDQIEEQGSLNLYGIGGNDLINNWDKWGLKFSDVLRRHARYSNAWGFEKSGSFSAGVIGDTAGEAVMFFPASCEIAFYRFQYTVVEELMYGDINNINFESYTAADQFGFEAAVSGAAIQGIPIRGGVHDAQSWTGLFRTGDFALGSHMGRLGVGAFYSDSWVGASLSYGFTPLPINFKYIKLKYEYLGDPIRLEDLGKKGKCACNALRMYSIRQSYSGTILNNIIRLFK